MIAAVRILVVVAAVAIELKITGVIISGGSYFYLLLILGIIVPISVVIGIVVDVCLVVNIQGLVAGFTFHI